MGAITSFLNIDYTTEEGKIKIAAIIGAIALMIIIIVIIVKSCSKEEFKQRLQRPQRLSTSQQTQQSQNNNVETVVNILKQQEKNCKQCDQLKDINPILLRDALRQKTGMNISLQQAIQGKKTLYGDAFIATPNRIINNLEQSPQGKGVELALPKKISPAPINPNTQQVAQQQPEEQTVASHVKQLSKEQKQQDAEAFERKFNYAIDDYDDYKLM